MAYEVVSTNLTSTYILDTTDHLLVLEGGSITSSGSALIGSNDGSMSVVINGTVASYSTVISLGDDATNTNALFVTIGQTGSVINSNSATGIFLSRTNAEVLNHGQIMANFRGVMFANGVIRGVVENTGTINASLSDAIYAGGNFASTTGTFTVFNSGLLSGGGTSVQIRNQSLDMHNLGTIIGDVGVSVLSNSEVSNTLNLNNSGVIIGRNGIAVSGSNAGDTVINSGSVSGDVLLNGGDDMFDGRGGTVDGWVSGGAGNDTYIIDDATITIIEEAFDGTDVVHSSVSFKLAPYIENLILTGADDIRGVGNLDENFIIGNSGDNRLQGKGGNDTIYGDLGADTIMGGLGNDDLYGEDGNDTLLGRSGNDKLYGGNGNDVLQGGAGKDTLRGNDGDDVLVGGLGKDAMFGGNGADTFVFNRENESPNSSSYDIIKDFVEGDDLIDLSGIAGSLDFIGSGSFGGTTAEVRVSVFDTTDTMIRVDLNGDGSADMKILVEGTTTLDVADFIL